MAGSRRRSQQASYQWRFVSRRMGENGPSVRTRATMAILPSRGTSRAAIIHATVGTSHHQFPHRSIFSACSIFEPRPTLPSIISLPDTLSQAHHPRPQPSTYTCSTSNTNAVYSKARCAPTCAHLCRIHAHHGEYIRAIANLAYSLVASTRCSIFQ